MTNSILVLLAIGAVVLVVLFYEPARRLAGLLIIVALAFALGWFWPKSSAPDFSGSNTYAAAQPCGQAF